MIDRWVNEKILKEELSGSKGISRRTAHNWMQELGFKRSRHQKCVYVDGHDRPDVLEARAEYVVKMQDLRKRMSTWVKGASIFFLTWYTEVGVGLSEVFLEFIVRFGCRLLKLVISSEVALFSCPVVRICCVFPSTITP